MPEPTEAEIDFLLGVVGSARRPLRRKDVIGAFAGLRPLLDAGGSTSDLSRKHAVLTSRTGVVTVVGGKLTTYRRMAQDAVDATEARLVIDEAVRTSGLSEVELVAPGPGGVTLAELVFGVTHEGAVNVGDLLDRRTRVGLVPADRDAAVPLAERALALVRATA